ncbi:MAG: chloride channel protein [Firmicutes bacterium]|nr:chloride channel protein [Bacillota bacterium]
MKENFTEFMKKPAGFVKSFLKWIIIAGIVGIISGVVGTAFRAAVEYANVIWAGHTWLVFLLPVGGLVIAGLYSVAGMTTGAGTDRIIGSVRTETDIPVRMGPLIFISTAITHLLGGSAGREGAALQLGGSIGTHVGRLFRLDEKDMSLIVLAGMSGVFSALFGTPLTAVFFALEVISVGVIYYVGLVPCLVSALTAYVISGVFGYGTEISFTYAIPEFTWLNIGRVVLLGLFCALLSILYIFMMDRTDDLFEKFFKNPFARIIAGALILIGLSFLFPSGNYNGSGMHVIFGAREGEADWWMFLVKILFTAVTIGCGFKGGEIVPTFFIGATMGCCAGSLIGLDPGFGAALGLVATFCGVINCPMASILLGIELFGAEGLIFFGIACSVSFMMSGYYGLYGSQKIMYSKTRAEYININAK